MGTGTVLPSSNLHLLCALDVPSKKYAHEVQRTVPAMRTSVLHFIDVSEPNNRQLTRMRGISEVEV